jgi:hypothetical protein
MVGGKNYKASPFNRATQARRQPGSTFKLFVYLAALRSGMSPDSIVDDSPVTIGCDDDSAVDDYDFFANAMIDEVRIYNRALSDAERRLHEDAYRATFANVVLDALREAKYRPSAIGTAWPKSTSTAGVHARFCTGFPLSRLLRRKVTPDTLWRESAVADVYQ